MSRLLPETLTLPLARGRTRPARDVTAAVVGGGIAGVAAATILCERGVKVVLLERERHLGGRAGGWRSTLESGDGFEMERGFHAFFRHYFNLRRLLQRIDPKLSLLTPLPDYPVLGPDGESQSFANLPTTPPLQFAALAWRSEHLRARDLLRVGIGSALEMLAFEMDTSFERWDHTSASAYLDSIGLPARARRMLFDVFAHSFFNAEAEMSAGELLMMIHFYFAANREGLVFDVAKRPLSTAIWRPFERWLSARGVTLLERTAARRIRRSRGKWRVEHSRGAVSADLLILALPVRGLKRLVAASPDLLASDFHASVDALDLAPPFAVWRIWLDRAPFAGRPAFAATTGVGLLDNISIYERLEDESRSWAEARRGSVLELHAYALPSEMGRSEIRAELLRGLHRVYPETCEATILEDRFLLRRDCPAFAPGSHRTRPSVSTPFADVAVCGDFVKLPFPSALMERAASSGMLAASTVLAPLGVRSEPLRTVARRGLIAPPASWRRRDG